MLTPRDEPALQEAAVQIILKLILGIGGGAILESLNLTPEAATAIIAAFVAAVLSAVQGWRTRNKVYSPLSVQGGASAALPPAPASVAQFTD